MRKLKEFPKKNKKVQVKIQVNELNYQMLVNGLNSVNMEDKWIIRFDNNTVKIYSSWTGYYIYFFDIILRIIKK